MRGPIIGRSWGGDARDPPRDRPRGGIPGRAAQKPARTDEIRAATCNTDAMQITKNAVAEIEYELKDDGGEVLDTSRGRDPLAYLHGAGNLIPGLEAELEGKTSGSSFQVRIEPQDAYGVRREELVQAVPRTQFPDEADVQPGMQFQAQSPSGAQVVTVVGVEGDQVTLDANHPLAGVALNFDVTVVAVREATPEELEHGHVHGAGGHAH